MSRPTNTQHGRERPRPIVSPWVLGGILLGVAVLCVAAAPSLLGGA